MVKLYRPLLTFQNNFLVSQVSDTIRPWNFPKYVSLAKEVHWWLHFQFFPTSSKFRFWSVNYTLVTWSWRHQLSSFHKKYPYYKFQIHTISRILYLFHTIPPPMHPYYSWKKVFPRSSNRLTTINSRGSLSQMLLKILQYSQENICVGLFF